MTNPTEETVADVLAEVRAQHSRSRTVGEGGGEVNNESKPMRMKYWEEKSDQEKIEALAETVENLANRLYSLQCSVDLMERHQHAPDGRLLVQMSDRYAPQGPHNFHGPLNRKP